MRDCPRCGNQHIGCLIFAPLGWRVLFRDDWEEHTAEKTEDYQYSFLAHQQRQQLPMVQAPSNSLPFEGARIVF